MIFASVRSSSQRTPRSARGIRSPATTMTSKSGRASPDGRSQPLVSSRCRSDMTQTRTALLLDRQGGRVDLGEGVGLAVVHAASDLAPVADHVADDVDVLEPRLDLGRRQPLGM